VQKYGYLEQYNFDIQRQLPAGFFADVAYAGSHGVHLEQSNTNINQIPDSFIAGAASQYAAGAPVTIGQHVCPPPSHMHHVSVQPEPSWRLGPTGLIQGQLDRPYPQYSGLNLNAFGCCESNYNSLQATVTRRFQSGGTILVSYTNAKLMSNTDTLTSWLEGEPQAAWEPCKIGTTSRASVSLLARYPAAPGSQLRARSALWAR